jgi:hypothetical protein
LQRRLPQSRLILPDSTKSNFYTVDPNFTTAGGSEYLTGIVKNTLEVTTREPKVEWVTESATAGDNYKYCIENTMAAGYQKFGAATRLVLKGQYAPWKPVNLL